MTTYLPSKKFVRITGSLFVFLLITWGVYAYLSGGKTIFTKEDSREGMLVQDVINRDTDLDTIPDWEEELWGTDPNKKDSDGDGMSDEVEINARRDALNTDSGDGNPDGKINETERFAREFFSTVSSLKASGDLNQNSITNLALGFGKNLNEFQVLPDVYNSSDITTTQVTTPVIQEYYDAFQAVQVAYKNSTGHEYAVLAEGIDTEDADTMTDVAKIGQAYEDMAKELKALIVPIDTLNNHIVLINSYAKTGAALKNASTLLDNPLLGLVGISQYNDAENDAVAAIKILGEYFSSHGII